MAESPFKDLDRLRGEITKYAKQAYDHRLIRGSGGNLSVRIPEKKTILVTPTDISLGDIEPEEIIMVDLGGEIIESPRGLNPSKETSFHLRVYRMRPAVKAVVHLHPPYATAYANKGLSLPMVTVSARAKLQQVPALECAQPGSDELCDVISQGIESYPEANAFLMKEHGILTMAEDLRTAYYLADLIEETAQIAFLEDQISGC